MLENCKRLICSPSLNEVYCIVLYCIVLYCIVLCLFCDWIFLFLLAGGSIGHSFSQKTVCCMFESSMIFFHWMFHYPGTHLDPHPYHL